jgi:hypothetical protein
MKVKVDIFITYTKLMAILVLLVGCIFSYIYNSSEVIIFTLSLSAGLAGLKSWSDGLTDRRKMEPPRKRRYDDDYDDYEHQKINDEIE